MKIPANWKRISKYAIEHESGLLRVCAAESNGKRKYSASQRLSGGWWVPVDIPAETDAQALIRRVERLL